MSKITILDYGMGNILSVVRSFEKCGASTEVISSKEKIKHVDFLVLPGVGAFGNAMVELQKLDLIYPILNYFKKGNPFLGICLGMQLMMEKSYEFGCTNGLGLIPGVVERIDETRIDGMLHKVPYIGWNRIFPHGENNISCWKDTILRNNNGSEFFYFVHSYTAKPEKRYRLADSDYDGRLISAVIKKDNAIGCQFHPEKSGRDGLRILESFISM